MATLEKIRSKSVFLIIVVGVALLAFIIGDMLTNSRNIFGDTTTVAKVGGKKIDYHEYQRKRDELSRQVEDIRKNNPQQLAGFDNQTIGHEALNQLKSELLLLEAADDADIQSTGALLRYYMLEFPQNPEVVKVMQMMVGQGLRVSSPQQAYEMIFNPKRNGLTESQVEPFKAAWLNAEKETEKQIKRITYARLLQGSIQANKLDKQALYNDYVATANVEMAYMPFGNLDAKTYPVSDKEIKDYYNSHKNEFIVEEPTKEVSFIALRISPSQADLLAATQLAEKTVTELSKGGALSKDLKKEGVTLKSVTQSATFLPAQAKETIMSAGIDTVKLISNNPGGFAAIRLKSIKSDVDSVQLNIFSAPSEAVANNVIAALNGGLAADSVSGKFSKDGVMAQLDNWFALYSADGFNNPLPGDYLDSLRNNPGKTFNVLSNGDGSVVLAQLVKQTNPVNVYEYDNITYELTPSTTTKNEAISKFEKFLSSNNTASKFNANAEKNGYQVMKHIITAETPAIPVYPGQNQYFPESRQIVRWIMIDGEKDQVSHVYSNADATNPIYYAVAIDDAYEEYQPVDNKDVREYITDKVRRSKAGDKLMSKYSKNTQSVQAAAKAMGVQANIVPEFRFAPGQGVNDPAVIGKISGAKADNKVHIVKGLDGIYVYKVSGNSRANFPYNDEDYAQQYFRFANQDLLKMLEGTEKYQNNIYKFEGGN